MSCLVDTKKYLLHYFIISCYDFISLFIWYFGVKSSQPYLSNSHHLSIDINSSLLSSHVLISVLLFYSILTWPVLFPSLCRAVIHFSYILLLSSPMLLLYSSLSFNYLLLSFFFFSSLLFSPLMLFNFLNIISVSELIFFTSRI